MTTKKQIRDRRKEKLDKEARERKAAENANLPQNKYFLAAFNEDNTFKYPLAKKFWKHNLASVDQIHDCMRMIAAHIHQIRHSFHQEERFKEQMKPESKVYERNEHGMLLTKGELLNKSINEQMSRYTNVATIRDLLMNNLVTKISEDVFTGDMFNEYALKVEKLVKDLGFELFPDEFAIIYPR